MNQEQENTFDTLYKALELTRTLDIDYHDRRELEIALQKAMKLIGKL